MNKFIVRYELKAQDRQTSKSASTTSSVKWEQQQADPAGKLWGSHGAALDADAECWSPPSFQPVSPPLRALPECLMLQRAGRLGCALCPQPGKLLDHLQGQVPSHRCEPSPDPPFPCCFPCLWAGPSQLLSVTVLTGVPTRPEAP